MMFSKRQTLFTELISQRAACRGPGQVRLALRVLETQGHSKWHPDSTEEETGASKRGP